MYWLARRIVAYLLSRQDWDLQVWFRNSTEMGYSQFPWSDLDLTVWSNSENNPHLSRFFKNYRLLKKVIPILGEVNVYTPQRWNLVKELVNPHELDRDPRLAAKYQFRPNPSTSESLVFLLRMYLADHRLSVAPSLRSKKWTYHSKQVSSPLPSPMNQKTLLKWIVSLAPPTLNQTLLFDEVSIYLNKNFYRLSPKVSYPVLKEMRYVPTLFFHQTSFMELWPNPLEGWQADIIFSQARWEITGFMTQKDQFDGELFHEHLTNLRNRILALKFPSQSQDAQAQLVETLNGCLQQGPIGKSHDHE